MTTALQVIPEPQPAAFPLAMALPSLLLIEYDAAHVSLLTDLSASDTRCGLPVMA